MQGWNPQKPAKQDGNDTTTHSHHPYILCHFANYAPKKTFCMHLAYSHPLNEHGTQHCSLHSFPHKRQSVSAMFSSSKISHHNLNSQHITRFLHTRQTIPAMPSNNYIAATHNVTHFPCTSTCTTHPPLPSPLPSTTLLCNTTSKHKAQLAKWQDVGMV